MDRPVWLIVERYIRHVFGYEEEKWYENVAKYLDKRLSIEDILNYGIMQGLAGIGIFLLYLEWERDKGTKYGDKGNDHNFD